MEVAKESTSQSCALNLLRAKRLRYTEVQCLRSGVNTVRHRNRTSNVLGENGRGETVLGGVGELDDLLVGLELGDGDNADRKQDQAQGKR